METIYDYSPPVSKLLTLGDLRGIAPPDFEALGIGHAHIDELIRMAVDNDLHWADSESTEVWAPIYAWWALGQLQATAAVDPLVGLLRAYDEYDDDWTPEEIPKVLGQIGEAAIAPVVEALNDGSIGLWARVAFAHSLREIGQRHPDLRDQCVAALTQQLTQFRKLDYSLNGFLISYLTDLKAVESIDVIEQAFAADRVDLSIQGDWEDTQISLGLLEARLTPSENYFSWDPARSRRQKLTKARRETSHKNIPKSRAKSKLKAKAKRKQQKKARKKNRKRK